jgi:hypothetical protein
LSTFKQNEARIDAEQRRIWPNKAKINHWSLKDLSARCDHLAGEFDELYSFYYAELGWLVHSGVIEVAKRRSGHVGAFVRHRIPDNRQML